MPAIISSDQSAQQVRQLARMFGFIHRDTSASAIWAPSQFVYTLEYHGRDGENRQVFHNAKCED